MTVRLAFVTLFRIAAFIALEHVLAPRFGVRDSLILLAAIAVLISTPAR